MQNLACYDPVVAMYILVLIFKLVWLIVGSVWLANAGDECPSEAKDMVTAAIIIGWVVIGGGGFVFCCTLGCQVCCNTTRNSLRALESQWAVAGSNNQQNASIENDRALRDAPYNPWVTLSWCLC